MSGGRACECGKRDAWRVYQRRCNHSAFNGYRWTPSVYSMVVCEYDHGGCGAAWRTKAAYVDTLPDIEETVGAGR